MVQQFLFLVNTSLFSLFSSGNLPSFIELVSLLDVSSRSLYFALFSKLCAIFPSSCQFVNLFRFLKRLYLGYHRRLDQKQFNLISRWPKLPKSGQIWPKLGKVEEGRCQAWLPPRPQSGRHWKIPSHRSHLLASAPRLQPASSEYRSQPIFGTMAPPSSSSSSSPLASSLSAF